jgi:hypothetical protein
VALSFVTIGRLVRAPTIGRRSPRINLLRWPIGRLLVHPGMWAVARIASSALLALIVAAGVLGSQNPTRNLAPTAVWVIWWVGVSYLSALVGIMWRVVNPWSAIFAAVDRFVEGGIEWRVPYPQPLGHWPAVLLFGAFAWIALVFTGGAVPAQLALLILAYSLITWSGMVIFGRAAWLAQGDPFATAFGLLARLAPLELRVASANGCRDCEAGCTPQGDGCVNCVECFVRAPAAEQELNLRPPAAGLLQDEAVSPSMTVFVLLLLASVAFDGILETPLWSTIEIALYPVAPGDPDLKLTLTATAGLVGFALLSVVAYRVFAHGTALLAGHRSAARVASVFVLALVPIVLAYLLAHDFTSLLIQGQLAIPLASDPFGLGWDLLGTVHVRPDPGIADARVAWYVAVAALVMGHVVAVYVAHVVALRESPDRQAARRSRLVLLALLVGSAAASLWIVAQPIVEFSGLG